MGLLSFLKSAEQATEDEIRRASHKALHVAALAFSDAKKLVEDAENEVERCRKALEDAMAKAATASAAAKEAAKQAAEAAQAEAERLVKAAQDAVDTAELHANHVITIHASSADPVAPTLDPVEPAVELSMSQQLAHATQSDTTATNS